MNYYMYICSINFINMKEKVNFAVYVNTKKEFDKVLDILKLKTMLPTNIVVGTFMPNNIRTSDLIYSSSFVGFCINNIDNEQLKKEYSDCFIDDYFVGIIELYDKKQGDVPSNELSINELEKFCDYE